jgi:hypothetical protein
MKLQQKRYPFGSVTFALSDTVIRVEEKSLLSSKSFEIPLYAVASSTSMVRQFPLLWGLAASGATIATLGMVVAVFFNVGDSAGMIACVLMGSVFSGLAWHGFFERKIDFVILHSRESGQGIVFLRRTEPSVRHVEEFVEIVKERVSSCS